MTSYLCVELQFFIRGHHVYCSSWTPTIGEELVLRRQPENEHSEHAVAIFKDGDVVRHVPETRSRLISYFLSYDGNVGFCEVTGAIDIRVKGLETGQIFKTVRVVAEVDTKPRP